MNRKKYRRRWVVRNATICLLLAAFLLLPFTDLKVAAAASDDAAQAVSLESSVRATATPIRYDGKSLSVSAQRYNGYLFVPLAAFTQQFTTATYRYDAASEYAYLTAPGLTLAAGRGGTFLTANDRPLRGVASNRLVDGTMWVPLKPLTKALGLSYTESNGSIYVSGSYRALTPASAFYREDEVYWLSRIISAESRGEPLTGQIAVGNVILNRTRTAGFPNTIWGVIFEKNQFSPVKNGSIYNTPAWSSVIAAKMCLEGESLDRNILFFCNTTVSPVNWITQNRKAAFKIGGHTFYY